MITGASSGIGREFARQIAAAGINVVLVARRETTLIDVGRSIAKDFQAQYRVIAMDLSQEGFITKLAEHTKDLDIGLVVSNAGVEHWDAIQDEASQEQSKSGRPMFGDSFPVFKENPHDCSGGSHHRRADRYRSSHGAGFRAGRSANRCLRKT